MLIALLVLLTLGAFPVWQHNTNGSYFPSGGLALIIVIALLVF